uniref:Uncharacterized protein n=1 Tax=Streptomyces pratensis (strain ATCC 33331 / IAF-45CD) TaxID=591167 RepID=A0A8D3WFG5_STRFA
MGWWRKFVPVVWQETLLWEEEPQPLPVPRSLREVAATVAAPAAPEVGQDPLPVVAEEGWAGEYASFCLSFVRGLDESELLRRFGALADTHRPRSRGQAQADAQRWMAGLLPVVRAGRCGQWAFGIEEGHRWEGNRSEVLRRLSRGTQAVSLSFSGATTMSYYEDGEVVTVYDTRRSYQQPGEGDPFDIFPELPAHGPAVGRLLPDGRTSLGSLEVPTERTPLLQRATLRAVCRVVSDHFGIDLPPGALTGELASAQDCQEWTGDTVRRPNLPSTSPRPPRRACAPCWQHKCAVWLPRPASIPTPRSSKLFIERARTSATVWTTTHHSAYGCAQSLRTRRQHGACPGTTRAIF